MLRITATAFFIILVTPFQALAEKRVALVMGADDYKTIRPLANAVNDALSTSAFPTIRTARAICINPIWMSAAPTQAEIMSRRGSVEFATSHAEMWRPRVTMIW